MKCGAKRFLVEIDVDGRKENKDSIARTPAEAREKVRLECGENVEIISVRERS